MSSKNDQKHILDLIYEKMFKLLESHEEFSSDLIDKIKDEIIKNSIKKQKEIEEILKG